MIMLICFTKCLLTIDIVKMKKLKEITLIDNPIDIVKIRNIEKRMPQTVFIYDE